jgi:hypothetical protein
MHCKKCDAVAGAQQHAQGNKQQATTPNKHRQPPTTTTHFQGRTGPNSSLVMAYLACHAFWRVHLDVRFKAFGLVLVLAPICRKAFGI